MAVILGIDLGTSSIKAMLLDSKEGVIGVSTSGHDVEIPDEGFAEQNPEIWWKGLTVVLKELRKSFPKEYLAVRAVGFSGQMHGIVLTDDQGKCIRPAILWLDQRSKAQVQKISDALPNDKMGNILRNRVFTGFAFPSLLWVREKEPETWNRISAVMMPKDYLRFRMTGEIRSDVSDASASAIFDVASRSWSYEMIDCFRFPRSIFPQCGESAEIAGRITKECADELGLQEGIPVVHGSGDQPAQSIGNGVIREGELISNIGTGGQIAAFSKKPLYDRLLRTHTFCHALPEAYTVFGASLTSGMSMKWLKNNVLGGISYDEMNQLAEQVTAGSEGLIYLPYLSGERTPHMNPNARGVFFGLTLGMNRRHFIRAVMEGVAMSLRDSLSILEEMGIDGDTVIASGGGAKGKLWCQIQADVFGRKVKVCKVEEQALLGACIVAGVGTGIFSSFEQAVERFISFDQTEFLPNLERVKIYNVQYDRFKKLYHQTKNLM